MAAVPGAEWRVPLWNTAGFEPRRGARLRRTTDYYSRRRLLRLISSSSSISVPPGPPAFISCYTLPQEHRRSPAVPSRRPRTDNSDDDDDDVPISLRRILSARCTFGKGIGKMGRRKQRREGEKPCLSFQRHIFLLCVPFAVNLWICGFVGIRYLDLVNL